MTFVERLFASGAPEPHAADPGPAASRWVRHPLGRLVLLAVLFVLLQVLAGVTTDVTRPVTGWLDPDGAELAQATASAVAAIVGYALIVRWLERRRAVEVAPRAAAGGLLRGSLLGAALFTAAIAAIAASGGYRVVGTGEVGAVVYLLGFAVYAGVVEELVFRAVLFRITEELVGTWAALALSAALFGALHLQNPDATAWGAVATALEAGLLLGASYVVTRRLWVPIGLHVSWNFVQGGVFGVVISGSGVGREGWLRGELSGPVAVSGGAFGAEASVYAVVLCLLFTALSLVVARRTGRIRPPVWVRKRG